MKYIAFFNKFLYTKSMKKYKFQFSKTMYAVFILGALLCLAGVGASIYRIASGSVATDYDWIGVCVMIFACLFLVALIISMLIRSVYVVDEKYFTLWLGFIRTRYELKQINSVHLFEGAGRLVVYYKDNGYAAVVIKRDEFDDFIQTVTKFCDKIGFSYSTAEEEEAFKNQKKK